MIQDDYDFSKIALVYYDNPSCVDIKEFQNDIKRFNLLNRSLSNVEEFDSKTIRRIINSVIILYNIFGEAANELMKYKILPEHISIVIAVADHLNKLTDCLGKIEEQNKDFREKINELG